MVQAVSATIIEAYRQRKPASTGAGRGFIELSRNRRFIHRDGRVTSILKRLPQRRYYGPVDHEVGVIRIDDLEGSPIAVLVNYTAHPTIMRHKYRLYSAEFPGATARHVAAGLQRDVPVLFFNGAQGNIASVYDGADDWDLMERMGKELGEEVVRVHATVVTETQPKLKIVHRNVPLDTQTEDPRRAARLHMIFLDDAVIATVGGELFVQMGLQFKRRSLFPHTMVFGLTDGNLWYIPHRKAYEYGGYGVSTGPNGPLGDSFLEQRTGLGERLLEAWLEMMYEQAQTRRR